MINVKDLYDEMSSVSTRSIISNTNPDSRSADSLSNSIPIFTPEDLEYLSTLNQDEFISFRNNIIDQLGGEDGMSRIEEMEDENYIRIFYAMDGHEGIDNLNDFSCSYLNTPGGWSYLDVLLPDSLTTEQTKIYVGMAVYIDKIGRPIYKAILETTPISDSRDICELQAAIKLAIAGINIGVDGLIDIMTGGAGTTLTALETLAIEAQLTSIWIDYEICNGRWH